MDAKIATSNWSESPIVTSDHPAIFTAVKLAADQDTLDAGIVIAVADGSDEYVPYAPGATDGTENMKGVLTATVDTTGTVKTEPALEHGTVAAERVHVSGTPVTAAQIAALKTIGIYAR